MALLAIGFLSFDVTRASFTAAAASRIVQGVGQGLFLGSALTYAQGRLSPVRFVYLLGFSPRSWSFHRRSGRHSARMCWAASANMRYSRSRRFRHRRARAHFWTEAAAAAGAIAGPAALLVVWRPHFPEPIWAVFISGAMSGFTLAISPRRLGARADSDCVFLRLLNHSAFRQPVFCLAGVEEVDRRVLIASGLTLMSVGFVAVALAHAVWWPVVAGGILFGTGDSLVYPLLSAWMSEGLSPRVAPVHRRCSTRRSTLGCSRRPIPKPSSSRASVMT